MDTMIALADDIASAAHEIATREGRSLGDVVSDLARRGLERPAMDPTHRNGFPLLPRRGVVVTMEMVNALRDEEW